MIENGKEKKEKIIRRNKKNLARDMALGSLGLGMGSVAVSSVGESSASLANISKAMPIVGSIGGASMILKSTRLLNPNVSKSKKKRKNGSY